jgi:CheY-like chemotaxis protein
VPRRILLIDDSALILEVTRSVLEQAGYDVSIAMTVESFEAARREHPPDLIVIDVQMPEVFGDDMAGTLRGAYQVKTPMILLSSLDEDELTQRAEEAEIEGFVTKKSGPAALLAKVREVVGPP